MSDSPIYVPVEADRVTYVFTGPDAQTKHDEWALTGAQTWARTEPIES